MADLMADHQREASSPILTTEPLDLLIGDINNLNGGDKRKKNIKTNNCTTVHLDPKKKPPDAPPQNCSGNIFNTHPSKHQIGQKPP